MKPIYLCSYPSARTADLHPRRTLEVGSPPTIRSCTGKFLLKLDFHTRHRPLVPRSTSVRSWIQIYVRLANRGFATKFIGTFPVNANNDIFVTQGHEYQACSCINGSLVLLCAALPLILSGNAAHPSSDVYEKAVRLSDAFRLESNIEAGTECVEIYKSMLVEGAENVCYGFNAHCH
jgi:hypothetical protein